MKISRWHLLSTALVYSIFLLLPITVAASESFAQSAGQNPNVSGSPAAHPESLQPLQRRPRIGLVLSGGGARGAAHVGVLEVLEKLHIPVDYVAGTSVGSIVGGLYASGMRPADIEKNLQRLDVQDAMSDYRPRRSLPYRRKQLNERYLLQVEFGYENDKFFFPRGFVAGQEPSIILRALTLQTHPAQDFDDFPIPFRAVATDITTGEKVVLDHGDLAQAMRASMSIPGLYSPVSMQGHLLVDGGLTDNVPVDVVRKMGADIVIVVNVSSPLLPRVELNNLFGLSRQVINILILQNAKNSLDSLRSEDTLIQPDLRGISVTDFRSMDAAIKAGRASAQAVLQPLKWLQISPQAYAQWQQRHTRKVSLPGKVDFVEVTGNHRISTKLISSRIHTKSGSTLQLPKLKNDVRRIFSLGDFSAVGFNIIDENGRSGIRYNVEEKDWIPNYFRFGMKIADDLQGSSHYSLKFGYTRTNINSYGAKWNNELQVGTTRRVYTGLYQPIGYGTGFFIVPQAEYLNESFDIFNGRERIAEFSNRTVSTTLQVGHELSNLGEFRIGMTGGNHDAQTRVGQPGVPRLQQSFPAYTANLAIDSLDNPNFPGSGIAGRLQGYFARPYFGTDLSYDKVKLDFTAAVGNSSHSLVFTGSYGSSLNSTIPIYDQFTLGGFLSLSGLNQQQLRGQYLMAGHLIYLQRLAKLPTVLGKGLYAGISLEGGNIWGQASDVSLADLAYGTSVFVGADTVIGPLYFGYGYAQSGQSSFYLYLGRPF